MHRKITKDFKCMRFSFLHVTYIKMHKCWYFVLYLAYCGEVGGSSVTGVAFLGFCELEGRQ
jgi:hypothetical protein